MISITEKHKCCGCSACVQRCPKGCIEMREDEEGFLYPQVDLDACIDCGLCEKVCPVILQAEKREPLACYAAYNPDESVRRESSSGGIFSLLAEKTINEGGVVFGASWNEHWQVAHSYTETREGLTQFRGSKYVQSVIGESYKQAEEFLKTGRKVLFSGTPCQIAALKLFLRKDYDNLLTVDFICHGVPSPGVFRAYLQEELHYRITGKRKHIPFVPNEGLSLPPEATITHIGFRDKCSGWKSYSFRCMYQTNGDIQEFAEDLGTNTFLKGFLTDLYLRPSCHKCPAKSLKSGSDITIGDFWGFEDMPEMKDDDKGISAILVNTQKGQDEYSHICAFRTLTSMAKIQKTNGAIDHSSESPYREYFYSHKTMAFYKIVDKITSTKFCNKIARRLYRIIHQHNLK